MRSGDRRNIKGKGGGCPTGGGPPSWLGGGATPWDGSPGGARSRVEESDMFGLNRTAKMMIIDLSRGNFAQRLVVLTLASGYQGSPSWVTLDKLLISKRERIIEATPQCWCAY